MAGNIFDTVHDSLLLLFKDRTLFLLALTSAIVLSTLTYIITSSVIYSIEPFFAQGALAASHTGPGILLTVLGIIKNVLAAQAAIFLVSLFFVLSILTRAYYGDKKDAHSAFSNASGRYVYALAMIVLVCITLSVALAVLVVLAFLAPALWLLVALSPIAILYAAIRLSIALPYATIGGKGPLASLRMSWDTVNGNWWYVFLSFLIICIAYSIIIGLAEVPVILGVLHSTITSLRGSGVVASRANVTAIAFSSDISALSSPYYFVFSVITTLLNAWYVIALAVMYKQLTGRRKQGKKKKG